MLKVLPCQTKYPDMTEANTYITGGADDDNNCHLLHRPVLAFFTNTEQIL